LDAILIVTLAEEFSLTSFKKEVIDVTAGHTCDSTYIQEMVYKSLCFHLAPVHQKKKEVIITLTISLMQDQVNELDGMGIHSV
jgi:hypothetical protein